jgi:uncharacterized glyoxalase superfamily protein PhnB
MGQMNLDGKYHKADISDLPLGIEIAFVCDDVHTAYAKAVAAGAVAVAPVVQKPWGQSVAYVRSQEGSLIELCSPVSA